MVESKDNKVAVKVSETAMELLRDHAYSLRKQTGKSVTLGALLDEAIERLVKEEQPIPAAAPVVETPLLSPEMDLWKLYLERFPQSAYRMIGQMEFQLETTLEKLKDEKRKGSKGRKPA